MKIICGTDFSQHAVEAADVAAVLALRLHEPIALVHVFETALSEQLSKKQFAELRNQRQEKLKYETARLRKAGATVEAELLEGSPPAVLADVATKSQAHMIVVSSLGQIAPSRWFVGSVAERVAQSSSVPTLVVRGSGEFKAWAQGRRALNILVAYDFSASSDAALRWVSELRKIGPCKVTVAWVSWPPHERNRFGLAGHSWENPPEIQKFLERDLRKQCEDILSFKVQIRVTASWGRPDSELIELARTEHADLMIVGTNQRHGVERFWLGSVSRGILHHAPMSVACIPASAADDLPPRRIPLFKRVLVPTDFSQLGNQAIPFAYSTLYRGGSVCLLHVVEPTSSRAKAGAAQRKQIKKIEEQLRALIPSEAEARWLTTKVEVVESHQPSAAICHAAERFGADLICIGSHGRSGLSKAILGSVTHDVMARSQRPVLVVRPPNP